MKAKIILLLITILILPTLVSAATITGAVYNIFLDELDKAIITIDTTPEQTIVSKGGRYSLEAPPGKYTLIAIYEDNGEIYTTLEKITIEKEGNYNIDLILVPELEGDPNFENITEELSPLEPKTTPLGTTITLIVIIFFILYIILIKRHFINEKEEKTDELEDDEEKLIEFLKNNNGREK